MDEKNICVEDCKKCPKLTESRSQIVNGVGPKDASILLIGEAPGEKEDNTGKPFMGRSGDVLDNKLKLNDIKREEIRITNTVRCRPPDNRDPHKSEISNCSGYLKDEILGVDPDVVLTLGRIPTKSLLETNENVTDIAGNTVQKELENETFDVVVGIHPAATLYDPSYEDLFSECIEKTVDLSEN